MPSVGAQRLLHAASAVGAARPPRAAGAPRRARPSRNTSIRNSSTREAPHDGLDRRGEDVDAADDQHVVERAPGCRPPAARTCGRTRTARRPAARGRRSGSGSAASRAARGWSAPARPRGAGAPVAGIDHLGDELRLVDVQAGLRLRTRSRRRPSRSCPRGRRRARPSPPRCARAPTGMPAPGSPACTVARTRQLREVEAALARDLGEVQRVGRRAARARSRPAPPCAARRVRRVLAAARDRQRAERPRALEARPEADEEPEREREEHAVAGPHARRRAARSPSSAPTSPRTPACRASGAARRSCPRSGARARSARAGYVRLVPNGGCAAWSATSSALRVSGSRAKSSQSRRSSAAASAGGAPLRASQNGLAAEDARADERAQAVPLVRAQARRRPASRARGRTRTPSGPQLEALDLARSPSSAARSRTRSSAGTCRARSCPSRRP